MSEIDNPVRWLIPLMLLACVVGIPLMLWWERRRPSCRRWSQIPAALQPTSAGVRAAHDSAVVDAVEAASRIVREEAARVSHLYVD